MLLADLKACPCPALAPPSILVQFSVPGANDTNMGANDAAMGTWDLMAQLRAIGGSVNM